MSKPPELVTAAKSEVFYFGARISQDSSPVYQDQLVEFTDVPPQKESKCSGEQPCERCESGESIFDRTQDRLNGKVSQHQNSSIFMFADHPLPEFDGSFFFLPPPEVARTMVSKYFHIIAATVRVLHRSLPNYG